MCVVGAGRMGRLHVEKARALEREGVARLVGVAEIDEERRAEVSAEGVRAVHDFHELVPECDAAVVAVPAVHHYAVVSDLLKAGLDVLVEKPLASTLAEAESLLEQARTYDRVLRVGHQERFNPAMRAVAEHADRLLFVEAHRLGPFPARATDVDVVRDLMIHDLDIIQRLVGEEPARVEAVGVPVLTDKTDIANARVTFPGGCVANLTASRVSVTPMRKLRFFQPDGYFSIDFLERKVAIFRRIGVETGHPEIKVEHLELDSEDALLGQMRAWLEEVRERTDPQGGADEALSALRTALRVVDAIPDIEELQ